VRAVLKAGVSAYLDAFAGLVPCRVLAVSRATGGWVKIRVTRTVGAYSRGEVLERRPNWVVPRSAVRFRKFGTRILPYDVEE
jgi:hypothetical protein